MRFLFASICCFFLCGCHLMPSIVPATEVTRSEPPPEDLKFTLPGNIPLEMKGIGPGVFVMGSQAAHSKFSKTAHKVTLTQKFWIGKYEVTREQYNAVMGKNSIKHLRRCRAQKLTDANLPVCCISWYEAKAFTAKLNEIFKDKLPAGYSFDLPSGAQWEYACRANTTGAFNDNSGLPIKITENPNAAKSADRITYTFSEKCRTLDELGWYLGNSSSRMHPVGGKKPNAWGLYDMHGNVSEWACDDYTIPVLTSNLYSYKNMIDPIGGQPGSGTPLKVYRECKKYCGGSYLQPAWLQTSYCILFKNPHEKEILIGMRLAIVAPSVTRVDTEDTNYYSLNMHVVKVRREAVLKTALAIGQFVIESAPEILEVTSDTIDVIHQAKHGTSAGSSKSSSYSGSGSIRGSGTLRRGATATYRLYVNGKKVNASWSASGTSISVNDCGSYARVMAGNPPVSAGKTFRTRISATYRGKTFYKSITIVK